MLIYISRFGQQAGPYSEQQVETMLGANEVSLGDLAWHEGLADWQPLQQILNVGSTVGTVASPPPLPLPMSGVAVVGQQRDPAVFLYVPIARFIFLSVLSGGIYDIYWVYHNWRFLNRRDVLGIKPFWRAMFAYFYMKSLMEEIKEDRVASRIVTATFSPAALAGPWIVLTILSNIMGRSDSTGVALLGVVVGMPACLFLVPVQKYINQVNESLTNRPAYSPWSVGHTLCILLGLVVWLGILVSVAELAGVNMEGE